MKAIIMKRSVPLLIFVTASIVLFAQAGNGSTSNRKRDKSDVEQIKVIERRWAEAEDAYNPKVLNDVLADDFVSMNETGAVKNKA